MMLKDEVQMLRRVPLFSGVAPSMLKLLAFTSDRVSYAEDEAFFLQGDLGDAAYVILSGKAAVLADTPSGPIKITEVGENSIVGEIAILCEVSRTATVRAVTPTEVLRIHKEHFLKLMADSPEMALEIIRVLADRLSQTTAELTEARSKIAELRPH